jgi:N-acetylmuramoyl-L-alanine amidase
MRRREKTMRRMPGRMILLATVACVAVMAACTAGSSGKKSKPDRDLKKLASFYGFPSPSRKNKTVTLKSKYTTMVFEEGSRKLRFNNLLVWMHEPLTVSGRSWNLERDDIDAVVDPLLRADNVLSDQGRQVVVIDAGHGGSDSGAIGRRGSREKDIALDLAKRVKRKLADSQVTVRLTREKDRTCSLSARCRKANKWDADVFVSIHLNSAKDPAASGIESYVIAVAGGRSTDGHRTDERSYTGNDHEKASMVLGYYVQKGLLSYAGGTDRGLKRSRFQVLRDVDCPSVLVECGFLSNASEEKKLLDPGHKEKLAEGIARGILTYLCRVRSAQAELDKK